MASDAVVQWPLKEFAGDEDEDEEEEEEEEEDDHHGHHHDDGNDDDGEGRCMKMKKATAHCNQISCPELFQQPMMNT